MAGKQVLLLIDNFFIYYIDLNLFYKENPQNLKNKKIVFLPANAISICVK